MRHYRLPVDDVLRNAFLVRSYSRNNAERSRIDLLTTVADDANDHFLPTLLSPCLAAITFTQIRDIFHNAVHGPRE
jgi:hypothetical protein